MLKSRWCGDVYKRSNKYEKNSIEIVETADTVYIILRHTQMAISIHRIPKTSQKNKKAQGHFFGACVYHAAKSSDFNTDTPLVSAWKEQRKGETFERLQDTGGLYPPPIKKKRLAKKLEVSNREYPTLNTKHIES